MDRAPAVHSSGKSWNLFFLILAPFYKQNSPGGSFRRWVPKSRFEHSNRELLALYICHAMVVFVVHGDPLGSQGRAWGAQGRPRGSQRHALGRPGHPRGHSRGSGDVLGIPWILIIKITP